MRIAISTDSGQVSAHFGRCPEFTLVDVEEGKELSRRVIANPGHHPGFLPQFLRDQQVAVIIAGGMGPRAQALFTEQGIQMIFGVSGSVENAVSQFLSGTLVKGQSACTPGSGRGYGVEKSECSHEEEK
ncbi:MAG: dinitrogenase iron-molybdenum cofactor [Candidatus Omnitrophica bacterium]|nr:dinitrogenase iron-molybdenum cofactor [Candidatus Omnitrophota bacterium]